MNLFEQLKRDEGEVLHLYYDSVGVPTIGVGTNLQHQIPKELWSSITITQDASDKLLKLRMAQAAEDVAHYIPWSINMGPVRFAVLVNMAYNMGIDGLLKFEMALHYMEAENWVEAAHHMLDSKWARQVGDRAMRLATQMQTGMWI